MHQNGKVLKMLNIGIVDDNKQLLEILTYDLTKNYDIEITLTANNGYGFLKELESRKDIPEIILMDVEMPRMNGIEAVEIAKKEYPEITFIMLSVVDDEDVLFKAIKAGAGGYFLKEEPLESMVQKLEDVQLNGSVPFSPAMASKVLNLAKWAVPPVKTSEEQELTDREKEVLALLSEGMNSNEIGEKLFISFHTVRKHIRNIYLKLQVSTQAEAVKEGFLRRWLGF